MVDGHSAWDIQNIGRDDDFNRRCREGAKFAGKLSGKISNGHIEFDIMTAWVYMDGYFTEEELIRIVEAFKLVRAKREELGL